MVVSVANPTVVACLGCGSSLPSAEVASENGTRCLRCRSLQRGRLFPAAFRPPAVMSAPPIQQANEAACFHHSTKRASVACDHCGRFLCSLCQFAVGAQNLCPACIDLARGETNGRWVARRMNLDTVALATATLPIFGLWTTLVGAPAAIYLGLRALRQAPGPLPRGRWRSIVAIALGAIQVLIWAIFLLTAFGTALFRGGRLG